MKCKTLPVLPRTRIDLVTKVEGKSGKFCRRYGLICCIGILSLITLAYCIYLHYNLLKQNQEFKQSGRNLEAIKQVSKRNSHDPIRNRSGRNRRNLDDKIQSINRTLQALKSKVKDLSETPLVHLHGPDELATTQHGHPGCTYGQKCLLWNISMLYTNRFRYEQENDKIVGINITRAGYYFVYSQIGLKGLAHNNEPVLRLYSGQEQITTKNELGKWDGPIVTATKKTSTSPAFGFETVKVSGSGREETLSRSYITQDERGQWYDTGTPGVHMQPVDTVNLMGIFKLNCKDTVKVRYAPQMPYDVQFMQDSVRSSFGLMLVERIRVGDYGCF